MRVGLLKRQNPLKWKDIYGYDNITKHAPRITRQMSKIKVVLLGEAMSPKKSSSTRGLGVRLRRIMADAKKTGNARKLKAIRKIMRQRASFLRSMFRD